MTINSIAYAQKDAWVGSPASVGSAFTYQGQLIDASGSVTGNCDFQFSLWNALTSGTPVGSAQEQPNVPVSEGLFAGTLDISKIPSFGNRLKFKLSVLFGVWTEGDHRDWNAIRAWAKSLQPLLLG